MKSKVLIAIAVPALLAAYLAFDLTRQVEAPQTAQTTEPSDRPARTTGGPIVDVVLPSGLSPTEEMGKQAYDAVCAACHGASGTGRWEMGPPLIHKIYEPSHHGDEAFQIAVTNGVRAHHWRFGDMPAQSELTRADVATIVAYIRSVQRSNGIY